MPQVQVTIGGRPYRLACNPGEEAQLAELGDFLDARMNEMRAAFRDDEDPRIIVMAALSLADDLFQARRALEAKAAEIEESRRRVTQLEAAIGETTQRLEALCEGFQTSGAK